MPAVIVIILTSQPRMLNSWSWAQEPPAAVNGRAGMESQQPESKLIQQTSFYCTTQPRSKQRKTTERQAAGTYWRPGGAPGPGRALLQGPMARAKGCHLHGVRIALWKSTWTGLRLYTQLENNSAFMKKSSDLYGDCSLERGSALCKPQGHFTKQPDLQTSPLSLFLWEPVQYSDQLGQPAGSPVLQRPCPKATWCQGSLPRCTTLPVCGDLGAGALVGFGVSVPGVTVPGMKWERCELVVLCVCNFFLSLFT